MNSMSEGEQMLNLPYTVKNIYYLYKWNDRIDP